MTAGIDGTSGTDGTEYLSGNGHGEKLTIKHDEIIAALLTHPTIDSAARASGMLRNDPQVKHGSPGQEAER